MCVIRMCLVHGSNNKHFPPIIHQPVRWFRSLSVFFIILVTRFIDICASSSVRLRPDSPTWHMMATAWLQQEARLVRWIDLLAKVSEIMSSQYLLCETYPAMHVQLAVKIYPRSLCTRHHKALSLVPVSGWAGHLPSKRKTLNPCHKTLSFAHDHKVHNYTRPKIYMHANCPLCTHWASQWHNNICRAMW